MSVRHAFTCLALTMLALVASHAESADLDPDPVVLAPLEIRALGVPHPVLELVGFSKE